MHRGTSHLCTPTYTVVNHIQFSFDSHANGPAVSHVISGPKDITVCLPVLPQYQPVLKLVYQFHSVYLDIFTMLVGCFGILRQFPDRQTKNAGGHGKEGMPFF